MEKLRSRPPTLAPDRYRVTRAGFRRGLGNHFYRRGLQDMNAWLWLTYDARHLIARVRVEDDVIRESPEPQILLDAAGDHVRLSIVGEDDVVRFVTIGPRGKETRAFLIAGKDVTPLRAAGRSTRERYEAEVHIPWKSLDLRPAGGKSVGFDVAVCDADSRAGEIDSEFVWSGSAWDTADPRGYGKLKFAP